MGGSIVALTNVAVNSCLQDGLAPNFDDPSDPLAAAIRRRKNPPPTPPHEGGKCAARINPIPFSVTSRIRSVAPFGISARSSRDDAVRVPIPRSSPFVRGCVRRRSPADVPSPGKVAADPPAVPMLGSASSAGKKGVEGVPPLDLSSIPQEAAAAKPTAEVRARPPFLFDQQSGDQRIDSDGIGAVHLGILVGSLRTQRPSGHFSRALLLVAARHFGAVSFAADSFARALCAQSVGRC
jgi:hypothetical protein